MKIKTYLVYYYKSIIVFILIFAASMIPASEVQKVPIFWIPQVDKLVHLGMYFSFSFVLIFDLFKAKPAFSRMKIYLITTCIAIIYGGGLEILQSALTRERSGDWFDFLFDGMGVFFALGFWMILKRPK